MTPFKLIRVSGSLFRSLVRRCFRELLMNMSAGNVRGVLQISLYSSILVEALKGTVPALQMA